ncbi:MAG: hypothetical protein JJU05_10880 [Verrucomicrobia bacterium]|nr:hypothetical protein [Verrucomicrobiota bacterium]MCH8527401.1 hypothetical protein [Kiritimatiellia bacterium]
MNIEPQGERWIVTPAKPQAWPADFFKEIQIESDSFRRPDQGDHREFTF